MPSDESAPPLVKLSDRGSSYSRTAIMGSIAATLRQCGEETSGVPCHTMYYITYLS